MLAITMWDFVRERGARERGESCCASIEPSLARETCIGWGLRGFFLFRNARPISGLASSPATKWSFVLGGWSRTTPSLLCLVSLFAWFSFLYASYKGWALLIDRHFFSWPLLASSIVREGEAEGVNC